MSQSVCACAPEATSVAIASGTSFAYGLNDRGQIVGLASDAAGVQHAVMWDDDRLIVLGLMGSAESAALDIDESGYLLVLLDDGSQVHVREGEVIPLPHS